MMLGIASTRRALLFALNILDDNVHLLGRCCQADISSLRLLWPIHASYLTRRGVIPRCCALAASQQVLSFPVELELQIINL